MSVALGVSEAASAIPAPRCPWQFAPSNPACVRQSVTEVCAFSCDHDSCDDFLSSRLRETVHVPDMASRGARGIFFDSQFSGFLSLQDLPLRCLHPKRAQCRRPDCFQRGIANQGKSCSARGKARCSKKVQRIAASGVQRQVPLFNGRERQAALKTGLPDRFAIASLF